MFLRKQLTLKLSGDKVLEKLRMQSSVSFPRGHVSENKFRLYKTALHSGNKTRFQYLIKGTVSVHAGSTTIHYIIRPTILTCILLGIIFYIMINAVIDAINGAGNDAFLWASIAACTISVLAVIWQEQQCRKRFEQYFEEYKVTP